eukprot:CAMPEP_0119417300 /NCGR_PEP_ID=MMETSP1335-20130426/15433_1 /TAXON_ID=259385 /ORGANISM="Chrysoculter rhomboideus, Strain RCC1486" /LENGTH=71 /DNA_ID=CAMNT_0007442469 /DNA_START=232 /DNA_END=444 /DNA_ORIENTATION=+
MLVAGGLDEDEGESHDESVVAGSGAVALLGASRLRRSLVLDDGLRRLLHDDRGHLPRAAPRADGGHRGHAP